MQHSPAKTTTAAAKLSLCRQLAGATRRLQSGIQVYRSHQWCCRPPNQRGEGERQADQPQNLVIQGILLLWCFPEWNTWQGYPSPDVEGLEGVVEGLQRENYRVVKA